MNRRRWILIALALLLGLGCTTTGPEPDFYRRALAYERELLKQEPQAGYDNPRYIVVMRELRKVPRSSPDRVKADGLFQRISDGRRIALRDNWDAVDHVPRRLQGKETPRPPKPMKRATRARGSEGGATPVRTALSLSPEDAGKLDVTLYSTTWCGYCSKARSYFKSNGIPFVEKDIEKMPGARDEYQKKAPGYRGVPLIDVNGTVFKGFDQSGVQARIASVIGS